MATHRTPLGDWLWHMATAESRAVGAARRLAQCPLLTPAEATEARLIVKDEARHRDLVLRYAQDYAKPPRESYPPYRSDLETLMYMSRGEGALFWGKMRPYMPDPEKFDVLIEDEKRHRAWSLKIIHRLRSAGIEMPKIDIHSGFRGESTRLVGGLVS